jgi:hypothetical protein
MDLNKLPERGIRSCFILKDLEYGPSYSDPALFVHKLDRDGRFAFTWVDDLVGAGTPGNAREDMQKLLVKY